MHTVANETPGLTNAYRLRASELIATLHTDEHGGLSDRERTDMPIIFITGHGDVPTSVQAMKAGAVEFLTKPFKDDVLLDALRGAIERSRAALHHDSQMQVLREHYASLTRERQVMELVVSAC